MPKIVDHDRYRKELLMKSFDLFAEKGYGSASMRQIAQGIGVSTGTLYHYFPSKEVLFEQLIDEITQQDIIRATDEMDRLETIEEKIICLFDFLDREEDYFLKQIFLYVNFYQQQETIEVIKRSYQRCRDAFIESSGIKDPAIASLVLSLIDGILLQRAFDRDSISLKQQGELLARMLSAYLK
ncbi:MAG: TetR/AcrR family transcriptional regulator [Prochloraceae cyanobacterium]